MSTKPLPGPHLSIIISVIQQFNPMVNHIKHLFQWINFQWLNKSTSIAPQVILINLFPADPLNSTIYTIRLNCHGIHLYSFGVQGFIISQSLINDVKLKNIILYNHYGYTLSASSSTPIYGYPGVSLTPSNTFYGLYYFNSNNNKVFYFISSTYTQYAEVTLTLTNSNPSYMGIYILAILRNHCPDPYTYDET